MLVKVGGLVGNLSGSLGGITASHNRFGTYFRNRTKPTDPNSGLQQTVRSAFAFLSARWSQTLTAAQRTGWNLYGSSVVMKNKLGQDINLTGYNHYIRSNLILQQNGITLVDAPPTIFELPAQDSAFACTYSEATQLGSAAFDDTMDWVDEDDAYMLIFTGSPQNPQRNFFNGPWRYAHAIAGDSTTAPTTPETFTAPFVVSELQRIWTYGRIARADGRLSEPFQVDALASA